MSYSTIVATSPDRKSLWRHNPPGTMNPWTEWTQLGRVFGAGVIGEVYGGRFGLFRMVREPGSEINGRIIWWRRRSHNFASCAWHPIGLDGATFAVTAESVYGLTPDRNAVYRYNGTGSSWTQVGGSAGWIWGGTWGLIARNPTDGNIFRYLGSPGRWEFIGLPGVDFAVTAESVYGLTPDRQRVYRYNGTGSSWTQVGGPASRLYGGDYGLFATDPANGNLFWYLGGTNWRLIGGPGASFAVARNTVYGLTPDKRAVYRFNGWGTSWSPVGGPADAIYAYEEQDQETSSC